MAWLGTRPLDLKMFKIKIEESQQEIDLILESLAWCCES